MTRGPRDAADGSDKVLSPLPDGSYDAFVVDVVREGEITRLDLTIVAGPHKGEVVSVRATGITASEGDLIGMPATLTVRDGAPAVTLE